MMKRYIQFFLSFCLLLLCGYDHLYAHTGKAPVSSSLLRFAEHPEHVLASEVPFTRVDMKAAPQPDAHRETFKFKATEVEDEDDVISRDKISDYFLFYPLEPATFAAFYKNPLPFCRHFSCHSSCKFIVLRVIRI